MDQNLTVSATHFKYHIQMFEKLCGPFDYQHYQEKYGITLNKLQQEAYRPPLEAATEFFTDSAQILKDPCFGLTWVNKVQFKVSSHIVSKLGTAPDVSTFLLQSGRISALTSELANFTLEPFDNEHCIFKITPANDAITSYYQVDATLLFTKRITHTLLKFRYPDTQLNGKDYSCALISHQKPTGVGDQYEKEFAIPVKFNQSVNGLLVPKTWLNLRLTPMDLSIEDIIKFEIEKARLSNQQSHTDMVSNCIASLLPYGSPKREDVAQAFNMSLRSFQRRLSDENTHYKDILDQVRKSQCSQYLERDCYPLEEVAFLLGYSNISAFYTAFKRWHNTTPRQLTE